MAEFTHNPNQTPPRIYHEEPETKPAPLGTSGPLAWIRENLFGSPLDTALTVIGVLFIIFVVSSFFGWSVKIANWMAVTFNFRQFMLGTFERELEIRVVLYVLFIAFLVGVAFAAWVRRISPILVGIVAALLVVIFAIPLLSRLLIPLPATYFAAGNTAIVRGSAEEMPEPQLAFLALQGEEISVRFADSGASDEVIAGTTGYVDVAGNTLRNSAAVRLDQIATLDDLNATLGIPGQEVIVEPLSTNENILFVTLVDSETGEESEPIAITRTEYDDLLAEREAMEIPEPTTDIYQVNQLPVALRILDGETLEPLTDFFTLDPGQDETFSFEAPEDGWFVLEKNIVEGVGEGVALLEAGNILPIFNASESFRRVPDYFEVSPDFQPQIEGERFAIPTTDIIQVRYRGDQTLADYLRVQLSPFLERHNENILIIVIVSVIGYFAAGLLDRRFSPLEEPRKTSGRLAQYLLIAAPILLWIAVNGLAVGGTGTKFVLAIVIAYLVYRFVTDQILLVIGALVASFVVLMLLPHADIEIVRLSDPFKWGGLLLAVMLTIFGIIIAFPLGIGLALGRRSNLPAVKYACIGFIELIRGSPFITILFFFQLMIPFMLGDDTDISRTYRALIASIIFSAAYLAENVRGGLQSLPPGQQEAGEAVGLRGWQIIVFITLPQALRAVIPAIVSQFIGLFKDTSLVSLVGLTDPTRYVTVVTAQTAFKSNRNEAIVFVAIMYFVVSYVMSYVSRRIEETGSGSTRRI